MPGPKDPARVNERFLKASRSGDRTKLSGKRVEKKNKASVFVYGCLAIFAFGLIFEVFRSVMLTERETIN